MSGTTAMIRKLARLFTIKTRLEAFLLIYALALGAASRGLDYLEQYPGVGGWLLFLACGGAVMLAGAKILDCLRLEQEKLRAAATAGTGDQVRPGREQSSRRFSRPVR